MLLRMKGEYASNSEVCVYGRGMGWDFWCYWDLLALRGSGMRSIAFDDINIFLHCTKDLPYDILQQRYYPLTRP